MVQPGDPFPMVEGVPSGRRAVLLLITGDDTSCLAELDALEKIKPALAALSTAVVALRNPPAWKSDATQGRFASFVVDDAGVVVSRCDEPDDPTGHATRALRSVLDMPTAVAWRAEDDAPEVEAAEGEAPADRVPLPPDALDKLSQLEADVAKLAHLAVAAQPPPLRPGDGVPPPPSEAEATADVFAAADDIFSQVTPDLDPNLDLDPGPEPGPGLEPEPEHGPDLDPEPEHGPGPDLEPEPDLHP